MKVSVYIATSLDGFIARPNGDLDWLPQTADAEGEDYGYADFFESIDILVMGRKTFEKVLSFGVAWPYENKKVIILSNTLERLPENIPGSVELRSSTPGALIADLEESGFKHLYVDGGETIQQFIRSGLIDELIITRIPVLIGDGIPFFGSLKKDISLKHIRTTCYPKGFVQSIYTIQK